MFFFRWASAHRQNPIKNLSSGDVTILSVYLNNFILFSDLFFCCWLSCCLVHWCISLCCLGQQLLSALEGWNVIAVKQSCPHLLFGLSFWKFIGIDFWMYKFELKPSTLKNICSQFDIHLLVLTSTHVRYWANLLVIWIPWLCWLVIISILQNHFCNLVWHHLTG